MSTDAATLLYGPAPTAAPVAAPAPAATPPAAPAPPEGGNNSAADRMYPKPAPAAPVAAPAPAPQSAAPAPVASKAPAPAEPPAEAAPQADDASQAAEPAALTVDQVADSIRDSVPDAIKEDRARRGTDYYDAVPDGLKREIDLPAFGNMPEAMAKAAMGEFRQMAIDAGATGDDIAAIRTAVAEVAANPPTDEQRAASREACVVAFNEAFGLEAANVLAKTRAWVSADPRRAAVLSRIGDIPAVALRIAHLAIKSR